MGKIKTLINAFYIFFVYKTWKTVLVYRTQSVGNLQWMMKQYEYSCWSWVVIRNMPALSLHLWCFGRHSWFSRTFLKTYAGLSYSAIIYKWFALCIVEGRFPEGNILKSAATILSFPFAFETFAPINYILHFCFVPSNFNEYWRPTSNVIFIPMPFLLRSSTSMQSASLIHLAMLTLKCDATNRDTVRDFFFIISKGPQEWSNGGRK